MEGFVERFVKKKGGNWVVWCREAGFQKETGGSDGDMGRFDVGSKLNTNWNNREMLKMIET